MKGRPSHRKGGKGRPLCLAAGFFDGVHRGHQAVIGAALREARRTGGICRVLTFDRHPRTVVRKGEIPPLLTDLRQKKALFRAMGVEGCVVFRFTPAFAAQSPGVFLERLRRAFPNWRMVSVGADWRFGRGGSGKVEYLRHFGEQHGIRVEVVPPVCFRGKPISSTRIREALRRGQVGAVAKMLGRPFVISGRVVRGRGLGRRLGFPTANLRLKGPFLLADGVYACRVTGLVGKGVPAVMNVGCRPTVTPRGSLSVVEVHIPGFRGRLYGSKLEVEVVRRLRAERRFSDLEALRRQVEKDIRRAMGLVGKRRGPSESAKKGALQTGTNGL